MTTTRPMATLNDIIQREVADTRTSWPWAHQYPGRLSRKLTNVREWVPGKPCSERSARNYRRVSCGFLSRNRRLSCQASCGRDSAPASDCLSSFERCFKDETRFRACQAEHHFFSSVFFLAKRARRG